MKTEPAKARSLMSQYSDPTEHSPEKFDERDHGDALDLSPIPETITLDDLDDDLSRGEPGNEGATEPPTSAASAGEVDNPVNPRCPKVDNPVNAKRVISPFRDAKFLRDLGDLQQAERASRAAQTIVSNPPPYSHLSPGLQAIIVQAGEAEARKKAGAAKRAETFVWWRSSYLARPARSYRVPAAWRDTSDQLRLLYAHKALTSFGRAFAFSLRLHRDIEAKARLQSSPLSWLQKRIDRNLSAVLGRPVQFITVLEETDKSVNRALHLHGEIALTPDEATNSRLLEELRRALRKAAGEWETGRQYQCWLEADPDEGWASYYAKCFWKATPYMRKLLAPARGWLRITFDGPVLSITSDLRKCAEMLYSADRWQMLRDQLRH